MPERRLFVQHIRAIPTIDVRYWSFALSGMVRTPLILSYAELIALPARDYPCAIACTAGNGLYGAAQWRGVAVADLLSHIEIDPRVAYATAYSADGYSAHYPLSALQDAMLITHLDGTILPPEHGYPVRLMLHGRAGYKMPKWIMRIDLTAAPTDGFWESRGESSEGYSPAIAVVRGAQMQPDGVLLLSGEANTTSIQIRIDGGDWQPLDPTAITRQSAHHVEWRARWQAPYPGDFVIETRHHAPSQAGNPTSTIIRVPPEYFA
jgi:DMSO/TMAO reductase YedYZ molybdopterin-dependent catalytic subunit